MEISKVILRTIWLGNLVSYNRIKLYDITSIKIIISKYFFFQLIFYIYIYDH